MNSFKKITIFIFFIWICQIQAQTQNQNTPPSSQSNNVKVIVSLVVIFSFFLLIMILLIICYRTTNRLDNFASKIRIELANEYQNALNLQLEQAVKVNSYLMKSLAPEKPLMGKSMLKSSWWKRTNSPKKIKASKPEGNLIQLKPLDSNGMLTDPARNNV